MKHRKTKKETLKRMMDIMTNEIWQNISRDIVDPLTSEDSSYFVYDGWKWKDCGDKYVDGKRCALCLRIHEVRN